MKSQISIILSIIILIAKASQGEEIKCEYLNHYFNYYCKVLNILEIDTTASTAVGTHNYGKGISDVNVLFVSSQSTTKLVPSNSCNVFKNLKKFDISGRFVDNLKPDVFSGCSKVDGIKIYLPKLTEINEDLLTEVPNLTSISLTFTNIEILPRNLFKNNQKLTQINLSYNKFKAISTEFPVSVNMLSLQGNTCIDDIYMKELSTTNPLINFVKKIYNKCKNGTLEEVTLDQVKAKLMKERIDANMEKIMDLIEYFQLSTMLTAFNFEMELEENESIKQIQLKVMQNFTKSLKDFSDSAKLQIDLAQNVATKLKDEYKSMGTKVIESTLEIQKINDELSAEINLQYRLVIALLCFQIAFAPAIVFLVYMRKLYFTVA